MGKAGSELRLFSVSARYLRFTVAASDPFSTVELWSRVVKLHFNHYRESKAYFSRAQYSPQCVTLVLGCFSGADR